MNIILKSLLTFTFFLLCFSVLLGQNDDFMQDKESKDVFEVPSDKFSQAVQTAYTELLSRLTNDKNSISKSVADLNSKKNRLLQSTNRDINSLNQLSTLITEKTKERVDIENDIDLLRTALQPSSNDKKATRIINSINLKRYGKVAITDKATNSRQAKSSTNTPAEIISDNACKIEMNGIDPITLKNKIKISGENIVEYTHPKLEAYYKEQSFLTANASVMRMDKNYYLVLDIEIQSKDALRSYGKVDKGATLKAELLNGETAYLFAIDHFRGKVLSGQNIVQYQVIYIMNKPDFRALKKSEISSLGMMWSSGYEEYTIYNIDVVMNQIECLEKFK